MTRSPTTLTAVLFTASLCASSCTSTPAAPDPGKPGDPRPVTLDWVGRYTGSGSGVRHGSAVEAEPVELLIAFDDPADPECAACVTVTLDDYFQQANLSPQTATAATWVYLDEGVTRSLSLEKFSAGATPGTVLIGALRLTEPDGAGGTRVLVAVDLVLERI